MSSPPKRSSARPRPTPPGDDRLSPPATRSIKMTRLRWKQRQRCESGWKQRALSLFDPDIPADDLRVLPGLSLDGSAGIACGRPRPALGPPTLSTAMTGVVEWGLGSPNHGAIKRK